MGCSAVLLTNKKQGSKYKVEEIVRTHVGAIDDAYNCIFQTVDEEGRIGVNLMRSITSNAVKALEKNMTKLFKRVLPIWILVHYVIKSAMISIKQKY